MFGFVHPDDIGRMAYFGKNFAAHTDEKYDVFLRWKTPKMEDYHIFHSWANHVLVDGVSLGFFFYSDMEESGKNNQILDTHYQKYEMYQDRLTNLPNRRFLEIFGMEEVEEVAPAVEELKKMGYNVAGPISADSVFHQALQGRYNCVLSLYHDQGHIATKTLDFEKTIAITCGMPILRTSVDHGTAFDIAGKNIVSEVSMAEAIIIAAKYAPNFAK